MNKTEILKELIEMAEDGYKLHISNGSHQEFLHEDREVLREARKWLTETPGNVSPQAAVVAEEKFFTTDEVWRMYSEDPAYGHKSYKEFAEENGWVMVRLKAAPTPTEEQDKENFSIENNCSCLICGNKMKLRGDFMECPNCTPPLPVGELNKMAEERAVEMYKYQDGPDHSWDAMQNQRRQGFKDGFIAGYTARTIK